MNYLLLWIDALLIAALWVALIIACAGRVRNRWVRGLIVLPGLLILPACIIILLVLGRDFIMEFHRNWVTTLSAWIAMYLVISIVLIRKGSRQLPGMPIAAAGWRRVRILGAALLAIGVGYMVLINMDQAIRARCAFESLDVNSLYLATMPAIRSESENAAPLYEKAFAQLDAIHSNEVIEHAYDPIERFNRPDPAIVDYLKKHEQTIDLLHKAAALPGCRFDVDVESPNLDALLAGGAHMRAAGYLLQLHAKSELAGGNVASAMSDIAATLRLARHAGQRPMLISSLAGISMNALAVQTLFDALPRVKSENDLASLHLDELESFRRIHQQALRGEERFGLMTYAHLPPSAHDFFIGSARESAFPPVNTDSIQGAIFRVFMFDPEMYLTLMEDMQRLAAKPFYSSYTSRHDLIAQYKGDVFVSILGPAVSAAFNDVAVSDACDACAKVGVAMTRYRLVHSKLPAQLTDLVPQYLDELPLDPFDGKPIRIEYKEDVCYVYSAGGELNDADGSPFVGDAGEITFHLPK